MQRQFIAVLYTELRLQSDTIRVSWGRGTNEEKRYIDTTASYKSDPLVAWNAEHSTPPLPGPTSII